MEYIEELNSYLGSNAISLRGYLDPIFQILVVNTSKSVTHVGTDHILVLHYRKDTFDKVRTSSNLWLVVAASRERSIWALNVVPHLASTCVRAVVGSFPMGSASNLSYSSIIA